MSLTLISRETFQGVGTLSSGTPGNLGSNIVGSFYKRAVGPRLTSDTTAGSLGWSADLRINASSSVSREHTYNISATGALNNGMFSSWYFINSLGISGASSCDFNRTCQSNGNQIVWIKSFPATGGNFWTNRGGDWTDRDSGVLIPIQQWFELRHIWNHTTGNSYNYTVAYRLAGSSSWVTIISGLYTFAGTIDFIFSGEPNRGGVGSAVFYGRYGMPSLYSITSYAADAIASISDVTDPPTTAITWYADALNGDDLNDGVTSSSAWKTAAKITSESQYAGLFWANSYATGNTIKIDTSGAVMDLAGAPLVFSTPGLNIRAATGQTWITLKAHKTIAPGSWSTTGTANVYSTTDTVALACLWEDDKWLNHPLGANFAAVSAYLGSTPGSFWNNGTTLYVHPFGNTDPRSDGKTYDRTNLTSSSMAVSLAAPNLNCQDIYVRKTCDVDPFTDGYPQGGYGIQSGGGFSGTTLIKHCYSDYAGKHGIGYTIGNSGDISVTDNCQVEQCSVYGSQTPYVSYNANVSNTGMQHIYQNCICNKDTGQIGSTAGSTGGQVFYCHNNGGADQFSLISFDNCNFGDSTMGSTNAIVSVTINNTIFGGDVQMGAKNKTITRSRWTRNVPNQNRSDGVTTVRNCIFTPTFLPGGITYSNGGAIGTMIIENNTFDLTNAINQGGIPNPGLLTKSGTTTLTFRNNIINFPPQSGTITMGIFRGFSTADTLTITNNAVVLNGQIWAINYNDGSTTADRTFAQWKVLGFDANTQSTTNLMLDASYIPKAGSPLINAGVNTGPLVDYAGTTYAVRKTIGAYEGNNILLSGFYF